jgi:hypothetical protein
VGAAIQVVLDRDTVVTAYSITGSMKSLQVVFSHQKLNGHTTDHSITS